MKVHVVLPMYNDPLLCELYFRNYAKYKKQYVDKLFIVMSPFHIIHGDTIAEYELKNKIVRDDTIDDFLLTHRIYHERVKEHEHKNDLLVKLLAELNINNYEIITFNGNLHGHMICAGIEAAICADAHIVIDEQDAYWLNDDYQKYLDLLQHIDLVGSAKGTHQNVDVEKFNQKFNRSWYTGDHFPTLNLPEFLSNRIIEQIKSFAALNGPVLAKEMQLGDVLKTGDDNTYLYFDTFQHINLEIYKKTDALKIFSGAETLSEIGVANPWSVVSDFMHNVKTVNTIIGSKYEDKVVYHTGELRNLAFANLSISHSKEKAYELLKDYVVENSASYDFNFVKTLRCNFYYQSLSVLHTLYNKSNYLSNFNHLGELVNYHQYNCSELIEKIL